MVKKIKPIKRRPSGPGFGEATIVAWCYLTGGSIMNKLGLSNGFLLLFGSRPDFLFV